MKSKFKAISLNPAVELPPRGTSSTKPRETSQNQPADFFPGWGKAFLAQQRVPNSIPLRLLCLLVADPNAVFRINGSIIAPKGFLASGVFCDIKKLGTGKGSDKGPKRDLALIVSETPATVAGMFTTNQVCAAR